MRWFGTPSGQDVLSAMESGEIGLITSWRSRDTTPINRSAFWAADNACYGAGAFSFKEERYLRWLTRHNANASRCIFATAPDVVGDASETLKRSAPMFDRIRKAGYKPAFVAQDGWSGILDKVPWNDFDVLFIGGTTTWKWSEGLLAVSHGLDKGKAVHMGRVNSYKAILAATNVGCSSSDGTFLAFGPTENLPRVRKWLAQLEVARSSAL